MNTSNQPEHIEQRLQKLAVYDAQAAALIGAALPACTMWPAPPPAQEWRSDLADWLAGENQPDIIVMLGAGTATEMQCLVEAVPATTRFLLMEQSAALAAALFRNWAMEDLAADGRLMLALCENAQSISDKLCAMIDVHNPPHIAIYDKNQITPESARFYHDVLRDVHRDIRINTFNVNTLLHHGPLWQFNSLKNLPLLLTNPGIHTLFDKFTGHPALVVGAGPSLNEALPFIKRNAHKFILLAAATALRPLRTAGIRPDLVIAVDGSRKTGPQFGTPCDDLFLACSSMVYPPALKKFRGIFNGQMAASPIDRWLSLLGQNKGGWVAAGTVTTTAIDLAIKMGCDPIISAGFDLSFRDDGTTHANQTMYHGARLDPQRLVKVPGNYADTVPTTEQFKVYIELLKDFLATCPARRFINATTGGARLNGMELQGLEILDTIAAANPDSARAIIEQIHADHAPGDLMDILDSLHETERQFADVIAGTQQAARICNRLIMILKSPCTDDEAVARRYLGELKEIDRKFAAMRDSSSLLLDMGLWPTSFKAGAKNGGDLSGTTAAIQVNRQSREIYEQISGAAQWSRELIIEATDTLEQKIRHGEGAELQAVQ